MDKKIIYLTKDEDNAIKLLAKGASPSIIQRNCILPASGMGFFTAELRRKTGIIDTRNPRQCREYLENYRKAMEGEGLTPTQLKAARFQQDRETYGAIAARLGIPQAEVSLLIEDACTSAGIFSHDVRARKAQWRIYLALFHPIAERPISDQKMTMLRLLAEGMSYYDIAEKMSWPLEYLKLVSRQVCAYLGLTAKGKNAQRRLIVAYLEHKDTETADMMNDPAF